MAGDDVQVVRVNIDDDGVRLTHQKRPVRLELQASFVLGDRVGGVRESVDDVLSENVIVGHRLVTGVHTEDDGPLGAREEPDTGEWVHT